MWNLQSSPKSFLSRCSNHFFGSVCAHVFVLKYCVLLYNIVSSVLYFCYKMFGFLWSVWSNEMLFLHCFSNEFHKCFKLWTFLWELRIWALSENWTFSKKKNSYIYVRIYVCIYIAREGGRGKTEIYAFQ